MTTVPGYKYGHIDFLTDAEMGWLLSGVSRGIRKNVLEEHADRKLARCILAIKEADLRYDHNNQGE